MRYILSFFLIVIFQNAEAQSKLSLSQTDTLGKAGKVNFSRYSGNKFLLVNVDVKDSSFKQYEELVAFSARLKGCKVVVFPVANNSLTAAELYKLFPNNFGSTNIIVVDPQVITGTNPNQVYKWLSSKSLNGEVSVNCNKPFYKILISKDGSLDAVFGPQMKITDAYILQAINK